MDLKTLDDFVWFPVILLFAVLMVLLGCGSGPRVEGRLRSEPKVTIRAGGDTESEVLTRQDLSQAQQSLEQRLVESVREIDSMIQNVTSTVRNYGTSPRDAALAEKEIRFRNKLVICMVGAGIFGLFAPAFDFEKHWWLSLFGMLGGLALAFGIWFVPVIL